VKTVLFPCSDDSPFIQVEKITVDECSARREFAAHRYWSEGQLCPGRTTCQRNGSPQAREQAMPRFPHPLDRSPAHRCQT
jgi:hypothetical protein